MLIMESMSGYFLLLVCFDDGTEQRIDLSRVLFGELYGPLRDLSLFAKVQIDTEVNTLVWPNGADFDPALLHDWPKYSQLFEERTSLWEASHESGRT